MKIKIIVTIEYEPKFEYYERGSTPEEMLIVDLENAKEDICAFLEIFPYKITGEIIK